MKRMLTLLAGIGMACSALAQTDTTQQPKTDTLRIGKMIIVRTPGSAKADNDRETTRVYRRHYKPSNLTTNWLIFDLGFTNWNDQTNYTSAEAQAFAPGSDEDWFKLKSGKSSNVNIWIFMQRLNLIKHVVNLKYGLGLEMNNYRFKEPVKFETEPKVHVYMDNSTNYSKNKLAADYFTVPMLLEFNFTPQRERGFSLAFGASAGYLYNSRQKTITDADGKRKKHDDFDLNPWKIQYLAELGLGPVKLYGAYATESIFSKGLDLTPYNVGIRINSW
ncbi:outer membrane beta-barrel protein [Paraflavitalea sp. CAU 1676]|uniref:outer membrane beta-barrel protein n=1 Tax=Paraflavitalea sp. CAU 1676 TaxID=3032598 RepID=UPI0023DC3368|nr:outer membrane beta-barrel protein [Paraflavitalea sp. CAU 1676]MDF2186976.1 outer membrane beta-barrel protein [Paraflavitalea sp. CAU 1676]